MFLLRKKAKLDGAGLGLVAALAPSVAAIVRRLPGRYLNLVQVAIG